MRRLNAFAAVNPAIEVGVMAASVPPAIMTSASSSAIIRAASPIEWVPVVHAVTTARFGPRRPNMIERLPDTILMMLLGM